MTIVNDLTYKCSECDWRGLPMYADCETCPNCGRDAVYAEDADPVNVLLGKDERPSAVQTFMNVLGGIILAVLVAALFLAPVLLDAKDLGW